MQVRGILQTTMLARVSVVLGVVITFLTVADVLVPTESEALVQRNVIARREAAYRANNIGVALIEQYRAQEAANSFAEALRLQPDLLMARINLAIANLYLPDLARAQQEADKVLRLDPEVPQAHYVLGLIARSQDRSEDAVARFQTVLKYDPDDPGTNIILGQIYVQQRKTENAVTAFRRALAVEPHNETALYGLGLLLTRTGAREEGQRLIEKFQRLRESGAGTSLGTNYLEQGRYAQAISSTGIEPQLVERATPAVRFTDVTGSYLSAVKVLPSHRDQSAVVLFDYDADGDLDLFDAAGEQRLLRNDRTRMVDVTAASGLRLPEPRDCFAAVAGDYDNDGKIDLFVTRSNPAALELYRNLGAGKFAPANVTDLSVAGEKSPLLTAAFLDADHDGDLDIFVAGRENFLFRNNGNQTFTNITSVAGLTAKGSSLTTAVVPTDFDNKRDIDLLLVGPERAPTLFSNRRDGTFADAARETGLTGEGFNCVAAGDLNKDGFTDFFLGSNREGTIALSDGRARFKLERAPDGTAHTSAAQFIDYDNDGVLDLIVTGRTGVGLWRNVGGKLVNVSRSALPAAVQDRARSSSDWRLLASGDLDRDGDTDLVLRHKTRGLRILRNDQRARNRSLAINLEGKVSNKSAVAAKIEIRAGGLWQKLETYAASPAPAPADLTFGLGKRQSADAVRVLWPAGILQTEIDLPAVLTLNVTELDRKPSSCPYIYTWNGERFEFVTDFLGSGEIGYLESPGRFNTPDPEEYVRIRQDQLREKDGRFELRVTNELEEALFIDKLQLLAVTHPVGTEVFPNEGMTHPPKDFRLFSVNAGVPPLKAVDEHGHDVLDRVTKLDRRYPDDFSVEKIRGYAADHSLTLTLPETKGEEHSRNVLLLTGWTDYSWSSDNLAAAQAGKAMKPPALLVKNKNGDWQKITENIGIPVGRPQTLVVDLTDLPFGPSRELRIATNMQIYWDQILVTNTTSQAEMKIDRLDPAVADLNWRGFSAEVMPNGDPPLSFDYHRVSFTSPWKVMAGRYTRLGDVRELLLQADNMFVVSRPGDQISLSFAAESLPDLPAGFTRTFLLYANGFSKEMDINSATPDLVGPLPFHGMTKYPYFWPEQYPLTEATRRYLEEYNTRVVHSPVPRVETVLIRRNRPFVTD